VAPVTLLSCDSQLSVYSVNLEVTGILW